MVKEEILSGLKYAIARGDSLAKAMTSFYNAGYLKKDVDEAARVLQAPQLPQTQPITQPSTQPQQAPQTTQQPIQQPLAPVVQRVSAYEQKPKRKGLMFVLVFFLILLLGILVVIFLFKDELAGLLGGVS